MMRRVVLFGAAIALAGVLLATAQAGAPTFAWQLTPTGSTARLRGLSRSARTSPGPAAALGTVLRTVDGGDTWQSVGPPGTSTLQFRDIEAFDAQNARDPLDRQRQGLPHLRQRPTAGANWT